MLSRTRSTPVNSPAPRVIPDTIADPDSNTSPTNGRVAAQPATSAHGHPASAPQGSAASERDARRHQRAMVRERSVRERGAKAGDAQKRGTKTGDARKRSARTRERLNQARTRLEEPSRRGRVALGETVSLGLIGIVLAGLAVGAILGALGAAGWIIGLLVATLTLGLSAALRDSQRNRTPRVQAPVAREPDAAATRSTAQTAAPGRPTPSTNGELVAS
jgi:hypothetical protein